MNTMKTLRGTDKQVAWAEQIRSRMMEQVDAVIAQAEEQAAADASHTPEEVAAALKSWTDARQWLTEQTAAGWWIDRRDDYDGLTLLRQARVELAK